MWPVHDRFGHRPTSPGPGPGTPRLRRPRLSERSSRRAGGSRRAAMKRLGSTIVRRSGAGTSRGGRRQGLGGGRGAAPPRRAGALTSGHSSSSRGSVRLTGRGGASPPRPGADGWRGKRCRTDGDISEPRSTRPCHLALYSEGFIFGSRPTPSPKAQPWGSRKGTRARRPLSCEREERTRPPLEGDRGSRSAQATAAPAAARPRVRRPVAAPSARPRPRRRGIRTGPVGAGARGRPAPPRSCGRR